MPQTRNRRSHQPRDDCATAQKARPCKPTASSETCEDFENKDIPVGFFKLMATVFMFLVVLSIPPGGSRECINCEPDNDVMCVAYKVYVTLLHFLLRITEIVEFFSGILFKFFSVISREICGLLHYTENIKSISCDKQYYRATNTKWIKT